MKTKLKNKLKQIYMANKNKNVILEQNTNQAVMKLAMSIQRDEWSIRNKVSERYDFGMMPNDYFWGNQKRINLV